MRQSNPTVPCECRYVVLVPKARQGFRRVDGLDRWEIALQPVAATTGTARAPPRSISRRRVGQSVKRGRPVRLSKIEVRAIVFRRAHPKAIEGRLCRLAPATEERQRAAAMEQTRRGELRFDALVAQDRIAPAHIEHVVRAHVMRVPDAEREAAAIVRTLEERVPARHPVDQDVLGPVEQPFDLARDVRVQGLGFLRLHLLDGRLTRRRPPAPARRRTSRLQPPGRLRQTASAFPQYAWLTNSEAALPPERASGARKREQRLRNGVGQVSRQPRSRKSAISRAKRPSVRSNRCQSM